MHFCAGIVINKQDLLFNPFERETRTVLDRYWTGIGPVLRDYEYFWIIYVEGMYLRKLGIYGNAYSSPEMTEVSSIA